MSDDGNLRLVRDIYAAFSRRDVPAVFATFSPEIEIIQSPQLPWGGHYRGLEGARQFVTRLTATITSAVTVERFLAAGDHVVVIGWTRGSVNATGARFDVPIAHVWTVRDGRCTRVEFYIDIPPMQAALAPSASGAV